MTQLREAHYKPLKTCPPQRLLKGFSKNPRRLFKGSLKILQDAHMILQGIQQEFKISQVVGCKGWNPYFEGYVGSWLLVFLVSRFRDWFLGLFVSLIGGWAWGVWRMITLLVAVLAVWQFGPHSFLGCFMVSGRLWPSQATTSQQVNEPASQRASQQVNRSASLPASQRNPRSVFVYLFCPFLQFCT